MDAFSRDSLTAACGIDDSMKRGEARDSLFLRARVRIGDEADVYEVRVRNLSEGGMMAELDRVIDTDTPVAIDLRGIGKIAGRIAWCAEHRIGISFERPIDPKRARKPVGNGRSTPDFAKPFAR